MSRLLLRHLLHPATARSGAAARPFSASRAAFSYRRASSAPSYYAAATAAAAQEQAAAAAAAAATQPQAAAAAAATEASAGAGEQGASPPPPAARGRWGVLKFGALAAVAAAVGGTGYVSYAYSLEEVARKTKEFRNNPAPTVPADASEFEKFKAMAYSTAMKVPVAAIELYLDVRSTIEDHVRVGYKL